MRTREGRTIFYSKPERALVDVLKQTDKIPVLALIKELSKQIHHDEHNHVDQIIVMDVAFSMIESAKNNNIVNIEKGIVSLSSK